MASEKPQPLIPAPGEEKMPDPDLNPLTNPILARNLGKWAQVYFTTPREQRDHAVGELLRELESSGSSDSAMAGSLQNSPVTADGHAQVARPGSVTHVTGVTGAIVCPRCGRDSAPQQSFCGYCGSPLPGAETVFGRQKVPVPLKGNDSGTLPGPSSPSSRMSEAQQTDLEWLREKSLGGFRATDRTSHPFRKFFVVVLLIAGIFFYFRWRNGAGVLSASKPELNVSNAGGAQPKAAISDLSRPAVRASTAVSHQSFSAADQQQEKPADRHVKAAALDESAPSPVPARANDSRAPASELSLGDNGERELAIAEDFLKGGDKARDASQAAKWLWKSVSKHNTSALIVLADLYQRGDGVAKSCEQAQVLLTAGARRGSADAAQKLRNLQSSGCR